MEKKVRVEMPDGRIVRVMPHLVEDLCNLFKAKEDIRKVKEPPRELVPKEIKKTVLPPALDIEKPVEKLIEKTVLEPIKTTIKKPVTRKK